jgi:pro-kumamolisin-like protein/Big-like domain-containing protein/subtilase family protein
MSFRSNLLLVALSVVLGSEAQAQDASPGAARVPLPGHVLQALAQAKRSAAVPGLSKPAEPITLTVVLRRSDPAGFRSFLRTLYDPASANYRKFLTPQSISDRFGPTREDYDAVQAYFERHGFTVAEGSANRMTLTLRGTRAQVRSALAVDISDYTLGERSFYANDTDPALPPHLASKVEAVSGLSNLGAPRRAPASVQAFWAACALLVLGAIGLTIFVCWTWLIIGAVGFGTGLILIVLGACLAGTLLAPSNLARSSAPEALNHPYNPPIVRQQALLGLSSSRGPTASPRPVSGRSTRATTPNGTGQTIGLVQFDNFQTSDVRDFLDLVGAPASQIDKLSQIHVNGSGAAPGAGESEVLLDIDIALSLAPGANVVVFDAPRSTSWQTVFNAMLDHGLTVISNSWSSCENEFSLADVQSIDTILQTASASGISVFNASGDTGSTCLNGVPDTVGVPASSPNATAVGGTSLRSSPGYVYDSETWWQGKGGFGVSRHFPRPSYQNGLSTAAMRSVPDVSVFADPLNGMMICQASHGGCPNGLIYGGTSMSAPVMAAYAAILNDAQGQNLGAFNQAVYPLANTGAFHAAASMGSDFAHVGLGSPNLEVLDRRLAGQSLGPPDADVSQVFVASALVKEFELPLIIDIPADGVSAGTVSVNLRDANGHTVSGKSVVLTPDPGSHAVLSPANGGVTSESNGAVVFKVTDLTPETVMFTAKDMTDNLVLSQMAVLTFGVPPAASGGINAFPETVPADGSSTATITVTLHDLLDRPTPGKRISIAQGSGHSVITGPVPAVTDGNGQIEFTVTDGRNEVLTYTAVDETDGLPVPGSATVSFSGSTTSCAGDPPTAAEGYTLTPFANGFLAKSFFYSNVNWGGCPGASNPSFGTGGSVYVAEFPSGNFFKLGSAGGTVSASNQLSSLGLTLSQPLFAPDGSLYVVRQATGSGFTSGEILQLDPDTGVSLRTVASGLSCPFVAIDPLSGDLFVSATCFGGGADDPSIRRIHDPGSGSPQVTVYATLPASPGGTLSFAPDGTLYVAYAYNGSSPGVVRIDGTDKPGPPSVTPLSGIRTVYWVRVAEAKGDGSAKSLLVHSGSALQLADLTADPPTSTTLVEGGISTGATGPDGCLYASTGDALYKLAPVSGGCGFVPTSSAPALTLSPSAVSPDPAQGGSQAFTATFRNVSVTAGSPVYFQISGSNAQVKLARTDANGTATIRYTGYLAGTDTVTASWRRNPSDATPALVSNSTKVTWSAPRAPAPGILGGLIAAVVLASARLSARSSRRHRDPAR